MTTTQQLNNPNELMVGIEDYVGIKLDWSQDNRGIILPIESLRAIYEHLETLTHVSRETTDPCATL
jgi:hypothetical protein